MKTIRLNITDDQGTLLGRMTLDVDDIRAALSSSAGAFAIVDDIATEAGIPFVIGKPQTDR